MATLAFAQTGEVPNLPRPSVGTNLYDSGKLQSVQIKIQLDREKLRQDYEALNKDRAALLRDEAKVNRKYRDMHKERVVANPPHRGAVNNNRQPSKKNYQQKGQAQLNNASGKLQSVQIKIQLDREKLRQDYEALNRDRSALLNDERNANQHYYRDIHKERKDIYDIYKEGRDIRSDKTGLGRDAQVTYTPLTQLSSGSSINTDYSPVQPESKLMRVEGILYSRDKPLTIIGGDTYGLHAVVSGGEITDISPDNIIVKFKDGSKTYRIGDGID
jgi:hypothetical protein